MWAHKIHANKSCQSVSVAIITERIQGNHYQTQHNPKVLEHIIDNTPDWVKKPESKSDINQDISKKFCLCLISANKLTASKALYQRHMPITVHNSPPGSHIQLITNEYEKFCLLGFLDSCAVINTINILVHQWIITGGWTPPLPRYGHLYTFRLSLF